MSLLFPLLCRESTSNVRPPSVLTALPYNDMLSHGTFPVRGVAQEKHEGAVLLRVLSSYWMPASSAVPCMRVILWDGLSQYVAVLNHSLTKVKLPDDCIICMRQWQIVAQYSGTNLEVLKAEVLQSYKLP